MRVLECQRRSKAGECLDDCEDAFVITSDFVCVVDGATSVIPGRRWSASQLTDGQWAAHILCRAIQEDLRPDMSPFDIVKLLTLCIFKAYREEPDVLQIMQEKPEERSTASLVIYSRHSRQLIFVGDCQAALIDEKGVVIEHIQYTKHVDRITSDARAMFHQAERLICSNYPKHGDPGRDFIQPLLV